MLPYRPATCALDRWPSRWPREISAAEADLGGRFRDNLEVDLLAPLTDGIVTLRRQHPDDLELHLAAVDHEQMR
jgi:hypothetical protein